MKIIQGGMAGVAAQFAEAGIELAPPTEVAKPEVEKPTEVKSPEKAAPTGDWAEELEADGLTAAEKAELTDKMKRAVGRRTARMREAEEFATDQYNHRTLAERRAEAAERELAELKAKQTPAPVKEEAPKEPTANDFKDDQGNVDWEKYIDAKAGWKAEQTIVAERAREAKAREQAAINEAGKALEQRLTTAQAAKPDWEEKMAAFTEPFPPHVEVFLQESELVGEILYHLGSNPEELKRVASLRPDRALVALAKIEGTLSPFVRANGSPSTKEPSKPNTDTDSGKSPESKAATPSKRPAPVITPLPNGTGPTDTAPKTQTEHVSAFGKREGVDLYRRKRH
jgi:hypothetical protein